MASDAVQEKGGNKMQKIICTKKVLLFLGALICFFGLSGCSTSMESMMDGADSVLNGLTDGVDQMLDSLSEAGEEQMKDTRYFSLLGLQLLTEIWRPFLIR